MRIPFYKPLFLFCILILVISSACGSASTPTSVPTSPPLPTQTTAPTQAPVPTQAPTVVPTQETGAVSSLDGVESAVIQIEAAGTFIDPEVGWQVNVGKFGTGFIIDPSGIAVTNNHVVTGAALLKVYVAGDRKAHNAKVLGVSECSDLAVIDIDGEGFPYLEWFDGKIKVGLNVYAAGFPLGDPNFTLTDGIVSKAEASGETSWASVDSVIEHTAKINPGNSGGPLVDQNGQVIGINYANVAETDQNFAIGRDEALKVIKELKAGKDLDSIGVNGGAVSGEVSGTPISGVWVRSVASGSPADKALVQPGDILYQLEGQVLATDGTMADYCDILRSHQPSSTLGITVIRFSDLSLLEGQLNGRELAVTGTFAETSGSSSTGETGTPTSEYSKVQDDTGTIELEVPATWSDVNGSVWESDWGGLTFSAPSIYAAPNLTDYDNFQGPGVFFAASDRLGEIGGFLELLDGTRGWFKSDCTYDSLNDYGEGDFYDPLYEGKFDLWKNCGGTDTAVLMLAARPKDNPTAYLILVEVNILSDADLQALFHILSTFQVIGSF